MEDTSESLILTAYNMHENKSLFLKRTLEENLLFTHALKNKDRKKMPKNKCNFSTFTCSPIAM